MTTVRLFVMDDAPVPTPVTGAVVRVFSADGVLFVTQGTTDENGEALFELPEDTYWVRFFKSGFQFPSRLSIDVLETETNAFEVSGIDLLARPPATDVNLCRVTGQIVTGTGAASSGATIYFMSTGEPRLVGRALWCPSKVYAHSDASGVMMLDLVRNTVYEAWIAGHDDATYRIRVPDFPSVDLSDLLFPYVASVHVEEPEVAVAARESHSQFPIVTLSSRVTVPYALDDGDTVELSGMLRATSDDPSVATVSLLPRGEVRITGRAPGTTIIRFSPLPELILQRQPPAEGALDTVTVTVTE